MKEEERREGEREGVGEGERGGERERERASHTNRLHVHPHTHGRVSCLGSRAQSNYNTILHGYLIYIYVVSKYRVRT